MNCDLANVCGRRLSIQSVRVHLRDYDLALNLNRLVIAGPGEGLAHFNHTSLSVLSLPYFNTLILLWTQAFCLYKYCWKISSKPSTILLLSPCNLLLRAANGTNKNFREVGHDSLLPINLGDSHFRRFLCVCSSM